MFVIRLEAHHDGHWLAETELHNSTKKFFSYAGQDVEFVVESAVADVLAHIRGEPDGS